jgi:uncharacterized membrane protein YdbT with pleckstrin-like domain
MVPLLEWFNTHFIITTKRLLTREGVLSTIGSVIPTNRIVSVQVHRSLVDRILGCGTLIVESASDEPLEFDNIRDVEHVHTLLHTSRKINNEKIRTKFDMLTLSSS